MQPDVTKAQAASLDRWADEWRREAENGVQGAAEVGWTLARIAKLMRGIAGDAPQPAADAEEPPLPGAEVGVLRQG